jgi:peptide/nickel transport system substrate-binding protein
VRRSTQRGRFWAGALALAMVLTACGGDDDGDGDATDDPSVDDTADDTDDTEDPDTDDDTDDGEPADGDAAMEGGDLIVGTTDTVVSLDPAKAYDYASSNILFNVGETLVGFPPGSTEPEPLLAESVDVSDDGLEYTFTLREGVTFSNGHELTSEDVAFSLERVTSMQHPAGAWSLLAGIESVDTPDEQTAVVTLSAPNSTFLPRLAYTIATILPSDGHYPAPDTEIDEEDAEELEQAAEEFVQEDLIGTGPYTVAEFNEGESIILEANPDYWGDAPANDRVMVRFFQTSSQMKIALETGEIDVAHRDFSPDEQADLEAQGEVQVIAGDGGRTRYIVLNPTHDVVADVEVRQAMAAAIDRDRIAQDVFNDAVEPLYSMIPPGYPEANGEYFEAYNDQEPGDFIDEPVSFSLHYGGERYGPTEPSLVQAIQRQLEETGLFEVDLVSTEWAQFTEEAWPGEDGQYPVFMLGWNPDYIDADTWIEQFYWSEGFLGSMYNDDEMDELIMAEQAELDPDVRTGIFDEIQEKAAEDVVNIPLFQETPYVFAQPDISGLEETMDEAMIMRYWVISKG